MRPFLSILFLLLTLPLRAANWYVDCDVSSSGAGTSWGAAWKEMSNIVWASVAPGDTINVSGNARWVTNGASQYWTNIVGKTSWMYVSRINSQTSGTSNAPIVIRRSSDAGHDGTVIQGGGSAECRISFNARSWITIDGLLNPALTNSFTNTYQVLDLRRTMVGWVVNQTNGITCVLASGAASPGSKGLVVRGVRTTGTQDINGDVPCNSEYNVGIGFGSNDNEGHVVEFCEMDNLGQDGIGWSNATANTNDVIMRFCYIHDVGDDGLEASGGCTVYNNIIRRTTGRHGHPDAVVNVGHGNVFFYNNIVDGFNTTAGAFEGVDFAVLTNFWVYGNLFQNSYTNSGDGPMSITVDQTIREPGWVAIFTNGVWVGASNAVMTWQGVGFLYNTTVGNDPGLSLYNRYRKGNTAGGFGYPVYDMTVFLTNFYAVGNILLDTKAKGLSLKGWVNTSTNWATSYAYGTGILYSNPPVVLHNILQSTNVAGNLTDYISTNNYTNILLMDAAQGTGPNFTNRPVFVNAGDFVTYGDFRLSTNDTAAAGRGTNFYGFLPGFTRDLMGIPRPTTGNWDIGALQVYGASGSTPPDTNIMVQLGFGNDPTANHRFDDASGRAAHALDYGNQTTPYTNTPVRTLGSGHGSYFGSFTPFWDGHPYADTNFNDGTYLAITNVPAGLTNAQMFTACLWAKYANLPTGYSTTRDHNATFLDAGYGALGAWHFGRYYSTALGQPLFLVVTNAGQIGDSLQYNWPAQVGGQFTNDVWHHYAVTVDCSVSTNIVVKLYLDGTNYSSTTSPLRSAEAIAGLTVTDPSGSEFGPWIAVGCWQHNGTPPIGDSDGGDYPNNGWMNGGMDDIRLYGTVLSDAQILSIFNEWIPPSPPASGSGTINGNKSTAGTIYAK